MNRAPTPVEVRRGTRLTRRHRGGRDGRREVAHSAVSFRRRYAYVATETIITMTNWTIEIAAA